MSFWEKVGNFFKQFFRNMVNDPVSTAVGAGKIAAGGATCYGMATGTVPINPATIGTAAAFVASGVHSIGTDSSGDTPEGVKKVESALEAVSTAAPAYQNIIDAIHLAGEKAKEEAAAQALKAIQPPPTQ